MYDVKFDGILKNTIVNLIKYGWKISEITF